MAHNIETAYTPRVTPASPEMPFGALKDASTPTTLDGTPVDKRWGNDQLAFFQRLLVDAGITPNNTTDTVLLGQYFDGLLAAVKRPSIGHTFLPVITPVNLIPTNLVVGGGTILAIENSIRGSIDTPVFSTDNGLTWTLSAQDNRGPIAYGAGVFVIASVNSAWTSPDGNTWTERVGLPDGETWLDLIHDGTNFVALSATSVATSPDGTTWTTRTIPSTQTWSKLAYGSDIIVAIANGGSGFRTMRSTDSGLTWTAVTSANDASLWSHIAFGASVFTVLDDSGSGMYSPDLGLTWVANTTTSTTDFYGLGFVGGKFVATIKSGTAADDQVIISLAGKSWQKTYYVPIELRGPVVQTPNGSMLTWRSGGPVLSGV